MSKSTRTFSADKPLENPENDLFNYAPFAEQLAKSIQQMSPPDGFVIAIYGDWGTGKSSVLNFVEHYIENSQRENKLTVVLRFNPWWFSGQNDILRTFFRQISLSLQTWISKYGRKGSDALDLFIELGIESKIIPQTIGRIFKRQTKSVDQIKNELSKKLSQLDYRILIIIDDIDRLNPNEIKQLFTVIKAVADLPNIIYLIACDRKVVSCALKQSSIEDGYTYLQKIIQVPFELPYPSIEDLYLLLVDKLEDIFGVLPEELHPELEPNTTGHLMYIRPMLKTARDIVRFTNALRVTYATVEGEVDISDFIVIEALRILNSDLHSYIFQNKANLLRGGIENVRDDISKDHERRLLDRLFPSFAVSQEASRRYYFSKLKICSPIHFDIYFRMVIPSNEVSMKIIRDFLSVKNKENCLQRFINFKETNPHLVPSLLHRLSTYDAIPEEVVIILLSALFDMGDEILYINSETPKTTKQNNKVQLTQLIINLLRHFDSEKRVKLLSELMEDGQANILIIIVLIELEHSLGRFDSSKHRPYRILNSQEIVQIEEIVAKRLPNFTASEIFWNQGASDIRTTLHTWHFLKPDELRRFIESIANDEAKLMQLLKSITESYTNFIGLSVSEIDSSAKTYIDIDMIKTKLNDLAMAEDTSEEIKQIAKQYIDIIKSSDDE